MLKTHNGSINKMNWWIKFRKHVRNTIWHQKMEITQHGYGCMDAANHFFLRFVFQSSLIKIYPLQKVMYCSNHKVRLNNFLLYMFLGIWNLWHSPGWVHNIEGDIRATTRIQLEELDERGCQAAWTPLVSSPRGLVNVIPILCFRNNRNFFKFSFVRHPFQRLISAYQNKLGIFRNTSY